MRRVTMWVLVVLAGVTLAAPAGGQGLTRVKFSYFPAFHTMTVMVASGLDLFRQEGLDVEMIQASSGALQPIQLISGEVDLTTVGLENVVALRREGKLTTHIYVLVKRMSQDFVVRNEVLRARGVTPQDPIERRLAALRGMRIGYTLPNAPTDRYARYYLQKAGLVPGRDAEMVQVGSPTSLVGAIRQGRIDAFMLTPPTPQLVELDGIGTILIYGTRGDVRELDNYPYTGLSVRTEWGRRNRDTLVRFVRALHRARQLIATDRERSLQALRRFFPQMEERALRAGYEAMLPALSEDGSLDQATVKRFLDLGFEIGLLTGTRPSDREGVLWTNEFVRLARGR
ncbi:MAG: ABC transporter substrate-binding protein [Armatimonadota bacterium]|nr:ABC transporter substrate-binding protein [Armatimonadota bacterium]MDR7448954.1 ABC transporter substrate-binding protein [Armatimonadota bacterium]MDR7460372.1 ABC transporter substrate-binding protein [Armatimonadota bacterium]MDR7480542.1 ABC transporter substrate-binding protein [Armatimonadota bacterium]MDR7489165.1 ABC transporter substrate-binding protein [Armatimonadota bacterium]